MAIHALKITKKTDIQKGENVICLSRIGGLLKKDDNVNGLTRIRFLECYVLSSFHFCKPIYDRSTLVWRTLAIRRKIKEADRLQHDFLKRKSLSINVCLCFDVI